MSILSGHRPGHQHWLKIIWPSNYQPDLAILNHKTFLQFGLFKEKITFSGSWQLESSYQLFGKGGNTSFAFLRHHCLQLFVSWFQVNADAQVWMYIYLFRNKNVSFDRGNKEKWYLFASECLRGIMIMLKVCIVSIFNLIWCNMIFSLQLDKRIWVYSFFFLPNRKSTILEWNRQKDL